MFAPWPSSECVCDRGIVSALEPTERPAQSRLSVPTSRSVGVASSAIASRSKRCPSSARSSRGTVGTTCLRSSQAVRVAHKHGAIAGVADDGVHIFVFALERVLSAVQSSPRARGGRPRWG